MEENEHEHVQSFYDKCRSQPSVPSSMCSNCILLIHRQVFWYIYRYLEHHHYLSKQERENCDTNNANTVKNEKLVF